MKEKKQLYVAPCITLMTIQSECSFLLTASHVDTNMPSETEDLEEEGTVIWDLLPYDDENENKGYATN